MNRPADQLALMPAEHAPPPVLHAPDDELLALSLWRPWPTMFFTELLKQVVQAGADPWGPKWLENRPCKPPARLVGRDLALHAAKRYDDASADWLRANGFDVPGKDACPTGVVGIVRLVGWVQVGERDGAAFTERKVASRPLAFSGVSPERAQLAASSPWCFGPFAWVVDRPRLLREAVPCNGQQMLGWSVPAEVAEQVRRAG